MRITALTEAPGPSAYRLAWIAAGDDGHPVATAYLRVGTTAEAQHRAEAEVAVHPAERRRGAGTALLAEAVTAARGLGRRTLVAGPVAAGSPGEAFLRARGLRPVLALTYARLALADVSAAPAEPHPGYRLVVWEGTVPDELAATFTAARRAMDDMPMDEADVAPQTWDVDRVRAVAAAVAARGDVLCTVTAVAETDGSIVGFSELVVPGTGTADAQHYGTAVLSGHRGRGLARRMKAEAIRHIRQRHPDVPGLLTDTADSNVAMRRVNDALGYRSTHRSLLFQLDL
ncbi:GNAT family N-acetyltransferase [Amorphoplanes nipponensis]|uniref:N-acetyltransferase n=1 Tax=Actinoplanes nipponensis TaxID=135950 RepID=A0A919MNX6_9ACTN|nr:GNAT family N-acetyltransferase [Actinoplanes nipponensis]GIE48918.1 N-acetyltransferase [Actinoplanes nipponensis]